ncbi:cupredoxin domain-containing protein [Actinotalea lenta]|uniref:cupredoxin domain-containing protein n=1 Tax=Actinotalea lenta TaxID=3064654 RepID=UPI003312FEDF
MRTRHLRALPALAAASLLLAGCVANTPDDGSISVTSSADACTLSATSAPSGTLTFSITNAGDQATEFYLLGADGHKVIGEAENIGPGLTRTLVVQVDPGDYVTACKPGMSGDGIRADFTVTGSGTAAGPTAAS